MSEDEEKKGSVDGPGPGPPSERSGRSNDLVIVDGFPALSTFVVPPLPGSNSSSSSPPPAAPKPDPIPPRPFSSFPSSLRFSSPSVLDSLLNDAEVAFSARTREGGAPYSVGCTYFVPCEMRPRCALEHLALRVFWTWVNKCGLKEGLEFEAERSGAEWWTLALDHGGQGPAAQHKKGKEGAEGKAAGEEDRAGKMGVAKAAAAAGQRGGGDSDDDDDDDDSDDDGEGDDEVALHFDADYGLEARAPNCVIHPRLATVTYLTSGGNPTVVLDRRSPPPRDADRSTLGGPVNRMWVSHPRMGKHVAFDGRLLHGAPGWFLPAVSVPSEAAAREDEEGGKAKSGGGEGEPAAKRRKLDDGGGGGASAASSTSTSTAAAGGGAESPAAAPERRVTFLVNVWLNHCPLDAELLEEEDVAEMEAPFPPSNDGGGGDGGGADDDAETPPPPFSFSLGGGGESEAETEPDLEVVRLDPPPPPGGKLGTDHDDTGDNDERRLDASPAGEEETVLRGRIVTLRVSASVGGCREASTRAASCGGGSAEIALGDGAAVLEVGRSVEEEEEEGG